MTYDIQGMTYDTWYEKETAFGVDIFPGKYYQQLYFVWVGSTWTAWKEHHSEWKEYLPNGKYVELSTVHSVKPMSDLSSLWAESNENLIPGQDRMPKDVEALVVAKLSFLGFRYIHQLYKFKMLLSVIFWSYYIKNSIK